MSEFPQGVRGSDIGAAVFLTGVFSIGRWLVAWWMLKDLLRFASTWVAS